MTHTVENEKAQYNIIDKEQRDIYDEAFRVLFLDKVAIIDTPGIIQHEEAAQGAAEMSRILTLRGKDMPPAKQKQLLNQLAQSAIAQKITGQASTGPMLSLGQLLTAALKNKHVQAGDKLKTVLALMPASFVTALKKDSKYPNTIPLLTLKALLNALQIPYPVAANAIWVTFSKLQQAQVTNGNSTKMYNRRGNLLQKDAARYLQAQGGQKQFFEDEKSLKIYLEELAKIL